MAGEGARSDAFIYFGNVLMKRTALHVKSNLLAHSRDWNHQILKKVARDLIAILLGNFTEGGIFAWSFASNDQEDAHQNQKREFI